jgi:hypothetical protein
MQPTIPISIGVLKDETVVIFYNIESILIKVTVEHYTIYTIARYFCDGVLFSNAFIVFFTLEAEVTSMQYSSTPFAPI